MRLKSAQVQNFKRFVDLTIDKLPSDAKLVVLLGPNGCGKSSLFDAFQRRLKVDQFYGMSAEFIRYYRREAQDTLQAADDVRIEFHDHNPTTPRRTQEESLCAVCVSARPHVRASNTSAAAGYPRPARGSPDARHRPDRTEQLSEDHLAPSSAR